MGSLNRRSTRLQSEELNSIFLRGVPDLMFLQTVEGVFVDYHAPDPSRLLVPAERFLGRHMRDVLPPAALRAVEPAFRQVADAAEPVVVEYELDLPEGSRHYEARMVRGSVDQIL